MKYLVTLKPLDKFFFGREQTFGEDNYFAKSVYFPQQTQILGMLRRELLIQNNFLTQKRRGEWVDKNYNEAQELVGKEQFKIDNSNRQDLGKIEKISELFMLNGNNQLAFISAQDRGILFGQAEELVEFRFRDTGKLYKEKDANALSALIYVDDAEAYKLEEIFKEDTQVGIQKSYQGSTKDNAFFKKTSYRLNFGFSFAFVLELKDEENLFDAIVTLGAERSQFKMELSKEDPLCESYRDKIEKFYQSDSIDKLILLSDSYIECNHEELLSKVTFAMTESTAIRTINEKMTKRVKDIDLTDYKFKKSITYNFFKQGSVFYEPKALEKLLDNKNLQQIGYNQYIIIKGEKK